VELLLDQMDTIRLIIAVLFIVIATGIFRSFMRVRRWGLMLGVGAYGAAGVLSLSLESWWPLLVGFALAVLLSRAGAEPPTDLRLDLPTIERSEVSDDDRVREYLKWWVEHDSQVGLLASRFIQEAWQRGLRCPMSIPNNDSWNAPFAEEVYLLQASADVRRLVRASRRDFRDFLDRINALSSETLMTVGEVMIRYDLQRSPTDFDAVARRIDNAPDMTKFAENYVADAIISARLRVLAWTYQYWHGERYELPHKRGRPRSSGG